MRSNCAYAIKSILLASENEPRATKTNYLHSISIGTHDARAIMHLELRPSCCSGESQNQKWFRIRGDVSLSPRESETFSNEKAKWDKRKPIFCVRNVHAAHWKCDFMQITSVLLVANATRLTSKSIQLFLFYFHCLDTEMGFVAAHISPIVHRPQAITRGIMNLDFLCEHLASMNSRKIFSFCVHLRPVLFAEQNENNKRNRCQCYAMRSHKWYVESARICSIWTTFFEASPTGSHTHTPLTN